VSRKTLPFALLAAAGLALYLWAALAAPVVWNSDSALDLKWAKTSPLHASDAGQPHPAKPGYLLFLAAALRLLPSLPETRSVVVVQSILLWLSIVCSSWRLARRRGALAGLALLALLLGFLRLRDASSAILSDAAAATLLLPIVALCLDPPRTRIAFGVLGIASALLFWIRPNVGFAAILLSGVLLWRPEARRGLAILLVCLAVLMVPAWISTRPKSGGDSLRGLGAPVLMGSARYYWMPWLGGLPLPEEDSRSRLRKAAANWRSLLSPADVDTRRELTWRLLHGLLGTDLYDARWSPMYRRADTLTREGSPFLVLAAIGVLVASAVGGSGVLRREKIAGLLLLALLLGHDLLFGSHPRYILPFLPVVFLFSVSQAAAWRESPARPGAIAAVLFAALVALSARNRGILDWEWGLIERPGVRIRQTIPRRALPASTPVTLHVRVAPLVLPTAAYLEIRGESDELLFTSRDAPPENPFVSVALPESILRANRTREVTLTFVSAGDYDSAHFLLFPVIPPPWSARATRAGSPELSPATGIARGALDWWAHVGTP
jgi:hypothetical protein